MRIGTNRKIQLLITVIVGLILFASPKPLLAETIYFDDFEQTAYRPQWTPIEITTAPNGEKFLGQFMDHAVYLTLNNLSPHSYIRLTFDFYAIYSWDGNKSDQGPDKWQVSVEGDQTLLLTTFGSLEPVRQAFPGQWQTGDYPGLTGASDRNLGYDIGHNGDAIYQMSFVFAHSSDTITIVFDGNLNNNGTLLDENWGLDNVKVETFSGPVGRPPSSDYSLGDQDDKSGSDADPVNTATGNFFHSETDLEIRTRGLVLEFARHYNSKDTTDGPLGISWNHSYNIVLKEMPNLVSVRWGNGRTDYWNPDGSGGYEPNTPGLYDALTKNPDDSWAVITKNLDIYSFNAEGRLQAVGDKNENYTTFGYDVSDPNKLITITDAAGKSLSLTYNTEDGLLAGIIDFAVPARTIQYGYINGRLTEVIDALGNSTLYTYNLSSGYLETITDQRGVTVVTNHYDGVGRVIEQFDGNGNKTTFTYNNPSENHTLITDANGNITIHRHYSDYKLLESIQNPLGHNTHYTYDDRLNRLSIIDRNGNTTRFEYDGGGNVISSTEPSVTEDPCDTAVTTIEYGDANFPDLPTMKIDALDNITQWQYDNRGNVIRQIDPNGNERTWTYNSFGQKLAETDENDNTIAYTYDSDGLLTQRTDPNGNNTWFGYDELWKLTDVTDGRAGSFGEASYTTVTAYDNTDRIISVTGPITSQSFEYDQIGNKTQITNGRGYVSQYEYDYNSNMIKVTRVAPSGPNQVTQYGYDGLDRKISMTDPKGNVTGYEYDSAGRLIRQTNAESDETTYTYDAHGNVLNVTDGSGVTVFYEYDSLHRKIRQIDELGNSRQWQYDKLGNLIKHTDAMGNAAQYEYDSLNRLISVVDDSNDATEYKYDAVGNLVQVKDAGGRIISKRYYDEADRLIRQEDGLGNAWQYSYDGAGNLIAKTRMWAKRFFGDFDNNGNVTVSDLALFAEAWLQGMSLTDIAPATGDGKSNFVDFGKFGQYWLENIEQELEEYMISYIYDNENRLIETNYPDSNQVLYSYDNNGNLISMTDSTGTSTYMYDELDRLVSSTDSFGKQVEYGYDIVDNRTSIVYPADFILSAKTVTYTYDKANRLDKITDWLSRIWDYNTDGAGRITELVYPNGIKKQQTFDDAGRLTSLIYKDSADANLITYSYTQDDQGNPIKIDETGTLEPDISAMLKKTSYSYDSDSRLISTDTSNSYLYDNIGNVISRTKEGTTTDFVYDFENRLVSQVTDSSMVQHVYDGRGNRIARDDNGSVTRYVLDHSRNMSHVLCETDSFGMITAYYIHGPEIVGHLSFSYGSYNSQRYYHTNHIGSVVALSDETESITDRYAYTPFGVPAGNQGATANPFTYIGSLGVMTEADGLYFMRARFYEPDTGRFLGKDPVEGKLADPMSLYKYNYASNPLRYIDPSGQIVEAIELTSKVSSLLMNIDYALEEEHTNMGAAWMLTKLSLKSVSLTRHLIGKGNPVIGLGIETANFGIGMKAGWGRNYTKKPSGGYVIGYLMGAYTEHGYALVKHAWDKWRYHRKQNSSGSKVSSESKISVDTDLSKNVVYIYEADIQRHSYYIK